MRILLTGAVLAACLLFLMPTQGKAEQQSMLVPIIGISTSDLSKHEVMVVYVQILFEKRSVSDALIIKFHEKPGNFSRIIQTSIEYAIRNVARAAHVDTGAWTVELIVPYPDFEVSGESCTAIIALSVLAMARGHSIPSPPDIAMTGTIRPNGTIGPVSEIPYKLLAASEGHFRKVLIPAENDADWRTPFLMHVVEVQTTAEAYYWLTGKSFLDK
jgi:predicted ATP-dependent protease